MTAHLVPDDSPLVIDLLDEEVMTVVQKGLEVYLYDISRSLTGKRKKDPQDNVAGIGIVIVTAYKILPYSNPRMFR